MAVAVRLVSGPNQIAGHSEVKEQRGAVRAGQHPLAVAAGFLEAVAAQSVLEGVGRGVADDGGVQGLHAADGPPRCVEGEEHPEPLDVGKLGHGGGKPSPLQTDAPDADH